MTNLISSSTDTMIVSGFSGALIIGDPVFNTRKRVGRSDDSWETSMGKITQALDIASKNNLLPVIVGDVIHGSREISQLLPLIQLLKDRRAVLLPSNTKWHERGQGHMAAALQASGVAYVAGFDAKRFQLPISMPDGSLSNLTLEAMTAWGGHKRLEVGERAQINIPEVGLIVSQGSGLPKLDGDAGASTLEAGRMIRLTQGEESLKISVFEVTPGGIRAHDIKSTAIVFSENAGSALDKNLELNRDSLFVDKLRASTEEALEDEGKGSLLTLIDEVCKENESDEWILETLLGLAKEAATA